jgi:hypothetical protein
MGSGPTVDILEYIVFPGHLATLEPSMWWGRVLFIMRLEVAAQVYRLHTVVRDTLFQGTDSINKLDFFIIVFTVNNFYKTVLLLIFILFSYFLPLKRIFMNI